MEQQEVAVEEGLCSSIFVCFLHPLELVLVVVEYQVVRAESVQDEALFSTQAKLNKF